MHKVLSWKMTGIFLNFLYFSKFTVAVRTGTIFIRPVRYLSLRTLYNIISRSYGLVNFFILPQTFIWIQKFYLMNLIRFLFIKVFDFSFCSTSLLKFSLAKHVLYTFARCLCSILHPNVTKMYEENVQFRFDFYRLCVQWMWLNKFT